MFSLAFLRDYLKKILYGLVIRKTLIYLLFFVVLTALIFTTLLGSQLTLKPGKPSPRDIRSPHRAIITDEIKTRQQQQQAAAKVSKVYREDKEALTKAEKQADNIYKEITNIKDSSSLSSLEKKTKLKEFLATPIKNRGLTGYDVGDLAYYLSQASPEDLASMQDGTLSLVDDLMSQPITQEALPGVIDQVKIRSRSLPFIAPARQVVELSTINTLRPNLNYDFDATQKAIDKAISQVSPVQRTIESDEIIVRSGDKVTSEHISILKQLGLLRTTSTGVILGGSGLLVIILFGLCIFYLKRHHRQIFNEERLMLLLGLIFVLVLAIAKVFTIAQFGDRPEINVLNPYLVPVAMGSMLVAILLNQQLAYIFTILAAMYVGFLAQGNPLSYTVVAFIGGAVGVLWVSRLNHSGDLARSGLYIACANMVTIVTMFLISGDVDPGILAWAVLMGALNGFFSAVFTIGLLPYLETVFSVTSSIKLLELSNPNQEVLRRLLVEAPGTYHHSIMVGNLAESAAQLIGANTLKVRVGAYFHDIGKLKRPYFFVENQLGSENPHEKIAPSLSALIITSHVKDGVEIAREKHLPGLVIDFIEQHHGTSLVKYFYGRALEEDREGIVNEDTFRYEGPKPQSKEVALVMLADSVEAAVRSMPESTPGRIEGMVRRIIKDRLYDNQLEECDLTFRDLNTIAESFSKILTGIYHNRIEYPDNLVRELERRRGNGEDKDSKSAD
ncbi:MAG: HD family phosphohydrolase [Ignavibacteriales bacterium]